MVCSRFPDISKTMSSPFLDRCILVHNSFALDHCNAPYSDSTLQNLLLTPLPSDQAQLARRSSSTINRPSLIPFPQLRRLTLIVGHNTSPRRYSQEDQTPMTLHDIFNERKKNGAVLDALSVSRCLVEPASIPWLKNNISRLELLPCGHLHTPFLG